MGGQELAVSAMNKINMNLQLVDKQVLGDLMNSTVIRVNNTIF